jgi:hypothetical protein
MMSVDSCGIAGGHLRICSWGFLWGQADNQKELDQMPKGEEGRNQSE